MKVSRSTPLSGGKLKIDHVLAGARKTLMFFEGLPLPHLGATILLRGAAKMELAKLKQVFCTLIFASYNWRLEKSFLMDEFAQAPSHKSDEFFGDGSSKESSPDFHVNKEIKYANNDNKVSKIENQEKLESSFSVNNKNTSSTNSNRTSNDEKKLPIESIEDFSDPLHLYLTIEDDVFGPSNSQQFSVAELPFSNKFKKALDDTILSVSPFLTFSIPYLETEIGRRCKLRLFFPEEIYYSEQFVLKSENSHSKNGRETCDFQKSNLLNGKV